MTHNPPNHYEPKELIDRRNSDEFHAKTFRNPETITREKIMDDFMLFVEDGFEMSQEEMSDPQALVNEFIGYDSEKSKKVEKEMLKRWVQSVKG